MKLTMRPTKPVLLLMTIGPIYMNLEAMPYTTMKPKLKLKDLWPTAQLRRCRLLPKSKPDCRLRPKHEPKLRRNS